MLAEAQAQFGESVALTCSKPYFLEVNPPLATKGHALILPKNHYKDLCEADETVMALSPDGPLLPSVAGVDAEYSEPIPDYLRIGEKHPIVLKLQQRLMDLGFLQQSDDGVRHFFFANDDLHERCRAYLREHCAEAYLHYYDDEGRLRPEFRATDEASALYNRDIGFYEKALLDKMYTEHYDFRRASIADSDGLIRRSPTRD